MGYKSNNEDLDIPAVTLWQVLQLYPHLGNDPLAPNHTSLDSSPGKEKVEIYFVMSREIFIYTLDKDI